MSTKYWFLVLCAVAIIAGAASYSYAKHEADKEALQNLYLNSALSAKADATVLTELRSGESEKALKLMTGLMEGELVTLGFYEQHIAAPDRSSKVYEYVAAVRAYYDRFPEVERPKYGKEGLALKRQ